MSEDWADRRAVDVNGSLTDTASALREAYERGRSQSGSHASCNDRLAAVISQRDDAMSALGDMDNERHRLRVVRQRRELKALNRRVVQLSVSIAKVNDSAHAEGRRYGAKKERDVLLRFVDERAAAMRAGGRIKEAEVLETEVLMLCGPEIRSV